MSIYSNVMNICFKIMKCVFLSKIFCHCANSKSKNLLLNLYW